MSASPFSTNNRASVAYCTWNWHKAKPFFWLTQNSQANISSAVGKRTLAGHFLWRLRSSHLQLNPSRARRRWLGRKKKKCPKQFAVRQGEPQSIRRVHFEALMVSLVLLNGRNDIVFSHPEQTALYSIKEMVGGIDSVDLSGQTVPHCLQNHCQFFSFFC